MRDLAATIIIFGLFLIAPLLARAVDPLEVRPLNYQWPLLEFELVNKSGQDLAVWDKGNSWGWDNYEIEVIPFDKPNLHLWIKKRKVPWSGNVPIHHIIKAGGKASRKIDLSEAFWAKPEGWGGLHEGDQIIIHYKVGETPEADKYHVVVGSFKSTLYVIRLKREGR